jgi:membrane protease subunit HflK
MKKYRLEMIFEWAIRILKPFLGILFAFSLVFTCIYRVESDEIALVLRFGRLQGLNPAEQIKPPGLHLAFPYIIDEVVKVPVGKIQQVVVTTHYTTGSIVNTDIERSGYLITGDNNIVLIEMVVKYRIGDPINYVLCHKNAEQAIDGVVSGLLRKYVSRMSVDTLLTTGKIQLAEDTKYGAQKILDVLKTGVVLTNVELTRVTPPEEVMPDFNAVTAAAIQKETLIQTANGHRVNILPAAQSQAQHLTENAKTQQNEALAAARMDIAIFGGLYAQYTQNPHSVNEGILRSRVNALLSKMQVVIVRDGESPPRILLP